MCAKTTKATKAHIKENTMAATSKSETTDKKPSWTTEVRQALNEITSLGTRPSYKDSTREFRIAFYQEELTKARVQVAFFEEMLELENKKDELATRKGRSKQGPEATKAKWSPALQEGSHGPKESQENNDEIDEDGWVEGGMKHRSHSASLSLTSFNP